MLTLHLHRLLPRIIELQINTAKHIRQAHINLRPGQILPHAIPRAFAEGHEMALRTDAVVIASSAIFGRVLLLLLLLLLLLQPAVRVESVAVWKSGFGVVYQVVGHTKEGVYGDDVGGEKGEGSVRGGAREALGCFIRGVGFSVKYFERKRAGAINNGWSEDRDKMKGLGGGVATHLLG